MVRKTGLVLVSVFLLCFLNMSIASAYKVPEEISAFLIDDNTNEHEYVPRLYTCGHFSRDLAKNATAYNISLGSAILSNNPVFKGHFNHIVNYYEYDGGLFFIDPQSDKIMPLAAVFFGYQFIRLYPDGTQVPSYWYKLSPTLRAD